MPRIQKKRHIQKPPRTNRWPRTYGMPRTLLDLPAEIILHILEAAHDSNDLFSLILTAPIFASIWKLYAASVSTKVLAHTIECYPSARQLDLDVYPLTQQPGLASHVNVASGFYETVQSHRRILEVDRCVDAFYTLFLKDCTRRDDVWGPYYFEANIEERQRFKNAFYYVWRFVKTSTYGPKKAGYCPISLPPNLNNPELSDTLVIVEIMSWMYHHGCSNARLNKLFSRAHKIYGPTDRVQCAQSQRWIMCCHALWEVDAHRLLRQKCWDALEMTRAEPVSLWWLWERPRQFLTEANGVLRTYSSLLF
jgi:hypothetical protein